MLAQQLTLDLRLRDDATFNNFYISEQNRPVLTSLRSFIDQHNETLFYLWGVSGCGRSHLLQACCHVLQNTHSVMYLPLNDYRQLSPGILEDMEQFDVVCLDNIDAIMGQSLWEETLFHFYNRAREQQTRLVVSANVPPAQLATGLADLQSRLAWGLVFQLHALGDLDLMAALQYRAQQRGLSLPDDAAQYVVRHCERSMPALLEVLNILDDASLIAKRRITVPFIKATLAVINSESE